MTQGPAEKPSKAPYRQSLRRWRSLQGFGGLVVATCFFLPNIEVCGSPFVPAIEIVDNLRSGPTSSGDWLFSAFIVFPYAIGLAMAITSIRYRQYRAARERGLGRTVHILLTVWAVAVVSPAISELPSGWDLDEALLFGWAFVAACYCCVAVLRGTAGLLGVRWFSSVCMLSWFAYWIASSIVGGGRTYVGVWLALAGSFLIFLATWAEATVGGVVGWWSALRRLTTCSMQVQFLDDDRCSQCGYLLIGLTSNRCPECGRHILQGLDNPNLPSSSLPESQ